MLNQRPAVYPYIPTSNRNSCLLSLPYCKLYILIFLHQTATVLRFLCISRWLYILIFLHQTATIQPHTAYWHSCISLYSYIKPQLLCNSSLQALAVYPYIPTSNRNLMMNSIFFFMLYILIFLHQTATKALWQYRQVALYILIFLHQTATSMVLSFTELCCISLYSYIKPQLCFSPSPRPTRCISLYSYIKPQLWQT